MQEENAPQLPAVVDRSASLMLTPVMEPALAMARVEELKTFFKNYMVENEDYGVIPGTPKPSLFKPGAEKLAEVYGLYPKIEIIQSVEDWKQAPEFFDYTIKCTIYSKRDNTPQGEGIGSCNSYEKKYKTRRAVLMCPDCDNKELRRSSRDPAYYCWPKTGGCGQNFYDDQNGKPNPDIADQFPLGDRPNPDMASYKNTILKMAKKRAYVDAVISTTRSSGLFTQDVEDMKDVIDITATEVQEAKVADKTERAAAKGVAPPAAPPKSTPTPPPIGAQPGQSSVPGGTTTTPEAKPPGKQFSPAPGGTSKPSGNSATSTAKPSTPAGNAQTAKPAAASELAGMDGLRAIQESGRATGWVVGTERSKLTAKLFEMFPVLKGADMLKTLTKAQAEEAIAWFKANNAS